MIRSTALIAGWMIVAVGPGVVRADEITVQSLLKDGYTIAGTFPSKIGWPGIFLQKGATLYLCFVGEKPGSPTIATEYCKPVK